MPWKLLDFPAISWKPKTTIILYLSYGGSCPNQKAFHRKLPESSQAHLKAWNCLPRSSLPHYSLIPRSTLSWPVINNSSQSHQGTNKVEKTHSGITCHLKYHSKDYKVTLRTFSGKSTEVLACARPHNTSYYLQSLDCLHSQTHWLDVS